MDGAFVADIVYHIVLYSALAMMAVPVLFFVFWKKLGFFKKHRKSFYFFAIVLFAGFIAFFYLTRDEWLLWYQAYPSYVQIAGLSLFAICLILMRLADHHLGSRRRLFWSVLKGEKFEIVTGGLYRIVRHPIYAMVPLMIIGALLYSGEHILFFPLVFNLLARRWYSRREEDYVRAFAAGDYDAYVKKTPNRFYPKII